MRSYYVYIIANYKKTTFYIGITNNLIRRMDEYKKGFINGFSKKYNLKYLVYYEMTKNVESAIREEKRLKKWNRLWKGELIKKANPEWKDLSAGWFGQNNK